MNTELLGYLAASCTTFAFVPQVWQAWKTKDLSSISLGMYALFCTGIGLWLAYGLAIQAWPVVIANILTLLLAGIILLMKMRQVWQEHQNKPSKKTKYK